MARRTPATTTLRLRLGRQLRELRQGASLSLDEAASLVGYTGPWLSRVENGEGGVRLGTVEALLNHYHLDPSDPRYEAIRETARMSRQRGWWQRLTAPSSAYLSFISFEEAAVAATAYESLVIPGLLQTEAYARAVISVGRETDTQAISELVTARMRRQEVLRRDPPLRLWAIIGEAALHSAAGGPAVMRAQLEHLVTMAEQPHVTIQILTFAAGADTLAASGPITVLDMGPEDPAIAYCETQLGDLHSDDPGDLTRANMVFVHLQRLARGPAESVELIRELVDTRDDRSPT